MTKNGMRAVHPGEVLREDYLEPLGLSINALARALHVPVSRVGDIVLGVCRAFPPTPSGRRHGQWRQFKQTCTA